MRTPHLLMVFGFAAVATITVACSSGGSYKDEPTPAPGATSTPAPAVDTGHDEGDDHGHEAIDVNLAEQGHGVFTAVGCSACHGENAQGTSIAPALAGHSELQVRRQVRAPIGVMPVFDRIKLTPDNLDALVAYVENLQMEEGGHMHGHDAGLSVADQSFSHHRMALTALEAGNTSEAIHHVEHLTGILAGQHLALMQQALTMLNDGDAHDAQHMIEGMLADVLPDTGDSNLVTLHLQQALAGLRVDEIENATHHIAHALAEPDVGDREAEIGQISEMVEAGDHAGAEQRLSALLGVASVGVEEHADDHADDPAPAADHDAQAPA